MKAEWAKESRKGKGKPKGQRKAEGHPTEATLKFMKK
jgi:hypothetical protein